MATREGVQIDLHSNNGKSGISTQQLMGASALLGRLNIAQKLGKQFSGNREMYESLGYKKELKPEDYLTHYERSDVASKIVDLPPKTTWRKTPEIRPLEEDEAFIEAVQALDSKFRLFHYLERIDRLSGIGRYGVLLVGLRGVTDLSQETDRGDLEEGSGTAQGDPTKLLYFSAYTEASAKVEKLVENIEDPRFGRVEMYKIKLMENVEKDVHWTHVIHVAEGLLEDDIYGTPRLKKVINRIEDLQKLAGGSAEMFWQNVAGIWHVDIDPEMRVKETDLEEFENKILEAMHGLRRLIQSRGATLEHKGGGDPQPEQTYDMLKQLIAATAEIPERVLFGSERGQLASGQDQKEWHSRIKSRQEQHAEPSILRPVLDFLIQSGVLPMPRGGGYEVEWPALDEPTEMERAEIADKYASAIQKVAPAGAPDLIITPWEFREKILHLPPVPPPPPEDMTEVDREPVEEDEAGEEE